MPNYRIEAGKWSRVLENCACPVAAIQLAAKVCTFARGYTDYDLMVFWPFNPEMLVDGRRAADIYAEAFGGNWALAARGINPATAPAMQVAA